MNLIKLKFAVNYIVFAVSVFAVFVNFITRSVAYFELARCKRLRFGFLALVPFLQYFILGKFCDEINLKSGIKTLNSFWFVFFSLGFCVPSAVSYIFPNLPLFTFKVINSQVYFLNFVLLLFNFFYVFFYVDCLNSIFSFYEVAFRKFFLFCSALFIIMGLDFFVSLFLLILIARRVFVVKAEVKNC